MRGWRIPAADLMAHLLHTQHIVKVWLILVVVGAGIEVAFLFSCAEFIRGAATISTALVGALLCVRDVP